MARLTTVQLEMVNSECGNGFELDTDYFKITNNMRLITHRDFGDTRYEYRLYFERKYKSTGKDKSRPRLTNRYIVLIKICKWEMSESLDVWVNQGNQKVITAPELTYDRKLLKHLQKLSHQLDDEKLKSLTFE